MKVLTKIKSICENKNLLEEIKKGKIFIYPTDTIYGIGCNALNSESVKKIRLMKNREQKPFSVIAPSKKWIVDNCGVANSNKWMKKLPGKYTLIMKLNKKRCVSKEVNNSLDTLGVRIPKHWFSSIIEKANIPFVTTSVNLSGEKPMTSIEDIGEKIKEKVDYIIYEGKKSGKPSTVVNLVNGEDVVGR